MRVVVLSHVYPSAARPTFGVFVRNRVRRVAARCPVEVVAPLPYFPGDRLLRPQTATAVAALEQQDAIAVHHPRTVSVPGVAKNLDAVLYCLSLLPFVRRLRRRFAFDLIDAHFGYPDGVAAALLGRALDCPVSITLRGNEHALRRGRRRQLAWAVRRAGVIAVSSPLAVLARDLGAAAERVRVIPNGIDTALFRPGDRSDARRRLGLPLDQPIAITVGPFIALKWHEHVAACLPALLAQHPQLLWIALGDSGAPHSRLPALHRLLGDLGVSAHVRIVPAQPHEEIACWLQAADVFCVPTEREGWPNALCEALACGLPVVATRVGAIPEIVREGVDGHLVPFFDRAMFTAALAHALTHPWDRAAIAARAAARSWEHVADEVLQTFRAAVHT